MLNILVLEHVHFDVAVKWRGYKGEISSRKTTAILAIFCYVCGEFVMRGVVVFEEEWWLVSPTSE